MSKPVAIITGASRGIGRAVAHYFAKQGYDLALIARNKDALETVQKEVLQLTNDAIKTKIFALDVSNQTAVASAVDEIYQSHGHIDLLFNNAGILVPGTSDVDLEAMHQMVHVNLLGAYYFIHAVSPIMKKQRSGTIFNLASKAGKRGLASMGAYCMTKFGLVGLSSSLYYELLPFGVRVCALCPSVIETDMTKDFDMDNAQKISVDDIVATIDYQMKLSPNAVVPEVIINCAKIEMG